MKLLRNDYEVVYADPPWRYNDKNPGGRPGSASYYPTMTLEELRQFDVASFCADDATLWLWSTWPHLPQALSLMRAWGFTYKTLGFIWVKITKTNQPAYGLGHWTRANSEPCLLGVRGKPFVIDSSYSQVIATHRLPGHSAKPTEARERIVGVMGSATPRVELFARGKLEDFQRLGWDAWGLEVIG